LGTTNLLRVGFQPVDCETDRLGAYPPGNGLSTALLELLSAFKTYTGLPQ